MRLSTVSAPIETALDDVISFESSMKSTVLDSRARVSFSDGHRQIKISQGGNTFIGLLDIKLEHQLGSKVWPGLKRAEVISLWKKHLHGDLANILEKAISQSDCVLKYFECGGYLQIYGVTSSRFVEMDQSAFRDTLSWSLKNFGIAPSGDVFKTPFGEIVEDFSVPGADHQVGLTCKVIYGLNNGYSSYRLNWGREVLICTNGLTAFERGTDRWIHTNKVEICDFVATSTNAAFNHLSEVEAQIIAARDRTIDYAALDHLMTRLAVATATKNRVRDRLDVEFRDTGHNEWSVSQALTYLGQHERAIPPRVKDELTRLGSTLLVNPLQTVAAAPTVVTPSGFYDILR